MNKKIIISIILLVLLAIGGAFVVLFKKEAIAPVVVNNFDECVKAGGPIMESYPRQCVYNKINFKEDIGNEIDKTDLIRVDYPRPNQVVTSPLVVTGQARGNWFFEASFPVVLTDWDGKIIAQGIAQAKSDWMTTDFVPFEAKINFNVDPNVYSTKGALILKKDNPSGLPQYDDALEIPINFVKPTSAIPNPVACTMEAKICPDGTAVGRTGPKCEFTPCPTGNGILPYKSGVRGVVTLGPTCPVVQNPPDPNCADKPYVTKVSVSYKSSTSGAPFAIVETNKKGEFSFSIPPGEYILKAVGGNTLPRCESKDISIGPDKMIEVNLSCDTGIR